MVDHVKECDILRKEFLKYAEELANEIVRIFMKGNETHDAIRSLLGSTGYRDVEFLASLNGQIDAHVEEWIAL